MPDTETSAADAGQNPNKVVIDGFEIEYETDPNAHNRVEPEDRGPGMDEPVHYTYARPEDKPPARDVRVCDAVKAANYDLVRNLIKEQGCKVHQRAEQDWTPLNFAAGKGDVKMVKLLVEELGADITAVGRDRRRPSAIARAANRKEVVAYLSEREKALGVWENPSSGDPTARPTTSAIFVSSGRGSRSATTGRSTSTGRTTSRPISRSPSTTTPWCSSTTILTVTKSMWRGEHVIFDSVTPEWEAFCKTELKFAIPEELL